MLNSGRRQRLLRMMGLILICSTWCTSAETATRPHIIIFMADDMGWNDVSFHGSDQILTPNIDRLAYDGVILHHHYAQPLCTPSRAAFLTGRYPLHTGMQHGVILEPEPWGLPLDYKLLPQHLNTLGYTSHAVGKWHLGYFQKQYTPTYRGFSSHYGFYNGYQDYYKHTVQASFTNFEGYDMRFNDTVTWEGVGRYSTDLYTERAADIITQHNTSRPLFLYLAHLAPHAGNYDEPLQAPADHVDRHKHIADRERRVYAGMVSKLDESVGKVVGALSAAGMLQDSILVFLSDNGAATNGLHVNHGSNWPLKGEKGTLWEGGIRTVSFVWSPLIKDNQRVYNNLFHISDWLPTLYSAAGGDVADLGEIDGADHWLGLMSGTRLPLPRHEILHNADEKTGLASLRVGPLKYINGTHLLGFLDIWSGKDTKYQIPIETYVSQVLGSDVANHLSKIQSVKNTTLTIDKIKNTRSMLKVVCKNKIKNKKNKTDLCDKTPCIFNVHKDPCEQENIYIVVKDTGIVKDFENRLQRQNRNAVKPQNKPLDIKANPDLHNHTWISWQDVM
ncbi:arylsulfatase B-like [Macrosteles quadrilineatus]|uniref:arylsulfatase B-like n=1 Tax=Macrosteles quadrilineatus TaxID=74068 RepID=UPI0023E1FD22|nr:arylsulfatase B-like [Macrosteles quadrilineatus]